MCSILLSPAALDAAQEGTVTPVAQHRIVEAYATSPQGVPLYDYHADNGMGAFAETATVSFDVGGCIPGKCVSIIAYMRARQQSVITMTADGVLEVRGLLSIDPYLTGDLRSNSRVSSTFTVQGEVSYVLQAGGVGPLSLTLQNEHGGVVERLDQPDGIGRSGRLAAGTYTFSAESHAAPADVRFTVGANSIRQPQCHIQMSQPYFAFGEVVTASVLNVANLQQGAVPVELKMWLKRPDGQLIPARNAGADGTLTIPPGVHEFGPLAVMGVGAEIDSGVWEFGCRLLDPTTGKQLHEDSDLFQIP